MRCSNLFRFRLHDRLAIALPQRGSDFGVSDPSGLLLRVSLTIEELAQLVCASRQRTAEQMTRLEHEDLIVRQGREVVLRPDRLGALVQREMASGEPRRFRATTRPSHQVTKSALVPEERTCAACSCSQRNLPRTCFARTAHSTSSGHT